MSRSTSKKLNEVSQEKPEQPRADKVVGTVRFKEFFVNRSMCETGPLRISFPQELSPRLRERLDSMFVTLTDDDIEQVEKAAREVRPRFFQDRFGNDAGK